MNRKDWNIIERNIQVSRQNDTHLKRRVNFHPAKNVFIAAKNGVEQAHEHEKELNVSKKPELNRESLAKKTPIEGLFNPHVVAKYLKWKSVTRVGPGFFNDGNTCFLNSTLQCLLYTPALSQILRFESHAAMKGLLVQNQESKNRSNEYNKPVTVHFRDLVELVASAGNTKSVSPRGMVSSIRRVGKQFKPFRQEDAHEYLRQLLDCMHEELLKANKILLSDGKLAETTFISRIFGGYLCNTLTCTKCGFMSKTFNHFQDLSLDICGGINSIAAALQFFTKVEHLTAGNEWQCDKCKARVKAKKQMTLSEVPNVLVLHLKRFSFGNMRGKITKLVQFPVQLPVPCTNPETNVTTKVEYNLTGVIVHHGSTTHSGHYISFIKAPNEAWHEMDDSRVSPVALNKVLGCQAYILLYSKKHIDTELVVESTSSYKQIQKEVPSNSSSSSETTVLAAPHEKLKTTVVEKVQPKITQEAAAHTLMKEKLETQQQEVTTKPTDEKTQPQLPVESKKILPPKASKVPLLIDFAKSTLVHLPAAANHNDEDPVDGTLTTSESNSSSSSPLVATNLEVVAMDSSINYENADDNRDEPQHRLRLIRSVSIIPFRFQSRMQKLMRWSWIGRKSLRSPVKSIVNDDNTSVYQDADVVQDTLHPCSSNVTTLEMESDETLSSQSKETSESSAPTPEVLCQPAVPLMSINKRLIALSNRSRETSSEGVWETVDPKLVEASQSIGKNLRMDEWKNKRSREADQWNSALDSGRQKKVKKEKWNNNEGNVNQFQKFQDSRLP